MELLYGWVRNITFYLIFITVVSNLLPNKKYEKYLKLFSGMVLILLVLQPLTGGLRVDDKIAYYFKSISFQKEADELKGQLSGMEGKRLETMIGQYQEAVSMDVSSMAEAAGFYVRKSEAVIESRQEESGFGQVISIFLSLSVQEEGDSGKNAGEVAIEPVRPVETVEQVEVGTDRETGGGQSAREKRQKGNEKIGSLRRRIADYYDLEENKIEIQLEDEQG